MPLPPVHKVDHVPVFIPRDDEAWDWPKIAADEADIRAGKRPEWPTVEAHPVARYLSGETRFDSSHVGPWLRGDMTPVRFVLRRMSRQESREVDRLVGENASTAIDYCARSCIVEITGLDGVEGLTFPLSEAGLERLWNRVGNNTLAAVGLAAMRVGRIDLDDAEKKH